tara:strand:- start:92 stop:5668 length:5577 start_codon:yes stop_codon:yes gene_type:complete
VEELKALYESYIAQGLLSSETTFEQFLNANDSIKESLYKQGVDSKVISNQTDLETFKSAWGDVKKKDSDLPAPEEVTESITETQTTPTSSESSERVIEVELEEPEVIPDPVDTESKVLSELQINPEDFKSWKEENLRPESKAYDFFKNILLTDEGKQFEDEEKIQKQVSSYLAQKLNKNLELIDESDEFSRKSLIEQNKKDSQTLLDNLKSYNKEAVLDEKEDRRKLLDRQEKGLLTRGASTGLDLLKAGANAAVQYSMGTAAALFSEADALLTSAGADKKGALAGISEMFLDAAQAWDLDLGQVKRSAFTQGKEVMYGGKEYIVSDTGVIYDAETNIRVDDIIPESDVIQIGRKAALIEDDVTNVDLGSSLSGIGSTLVNLYGLIKSGKGVSKALGVSPKLGMGLASFASTVADNMASVKDDLMAQGVSEAEANDKAVIFGNAIATLDGLFSGLAGSNEKLLGSTKIVKDALFDLAKKKGKDFSKEQLKSKAKDLIKENAKELFIEEIPVLLSEKGINSVINYAAGVDARSGIEDLKRADLYETTLLTVGATTGIGSKKLLTNNQRNDIVRQLAQNTDGLEKAGTKLVDDGLLTKDEAAKAINEVKAMEYAEAKTSGAVKITDNMLEAAALITKKEQLTKEKEQTDPSLVGDIDNRIASINKQLEQIKEKDDADVREIIKNEKDAIQDKETGDILDVKPAESVQEVEAEVREPAVEKKEEIKEEEKVPSLQTVEEDIVVYKGTGGKKDAEGNLKTRHPGAKGFFFSAEKGIAETYKGEGEVIEEVIPAGATIEEIEINSEGLTPDEFNKAEEDAINASEADVVKLNTIENRGKGSIKEVQYIIKPKTSEQTFQEKTTKQTSKAEFLKRRINKASKSPGVEGTVAQSVKQFLRINPRTVSDIDAYISQAESIVEGLKKSKTFKGDVKIAESVNIKKVDEYSSKELKTQEQTLRNQEAKAFEKLTGLSSEELSLGEMREILYSLNEESVKTPEEIKLKAEKKADIIAKGIQKAFSSYSSIIKQQIKTGVDPFTGEKIKISANNKKIIEDYLKIDLNNLNSVEQLKALDALINFATNQSTGGMKATIAQNKGVKEANGLDIIAKSLEFFKSKGVSQAWIKYISSIPLAFEFMFKGQSKGLRFEQASGFSDIKNGAAKAEAENNKVFDEYVKKYKKTKPNGEAFNTVDNDVERGMFAFMRRTVDGTLEEQQQEFKRRKGLVEKSIDKLKQTGETNDQTKAEVYEKIYNKILKDATTIDEVDAKVDATNKEAVEWITNEWASRRDDLADISLNVYNRILGKDINYTPDSFTLVEEPSSTADIGEPIFEGTREVIYDKETGVLKPKNPSFVLPEGRIVNLGFDSQNSRSLNAALTDIYTAEGIQQLKGFVNSDAYSKIIPNKSDRDLITERLRRYVDAKRGVSFIKPSNKAFIRGLNKFSSLGVGRALGGPTQFIKQLTPIVNTMANAGPVSTIKGLTLLTNPAVNKFLNNSGYGIANRGIQALSVLESSNSKIENTAKSNLGKAVDQLNKINQAYLQFFVANPDKFAARASWLSYYTNSLKKQGINPNGIDWNTHKINKEAADFAEQQVTRQQNVSDIDLQGEIFNSKNPFVQMGRKIFLPFANFLLNQKTRMYSDISTLANTTSTSQDKTTAAKSLGGLAAETIAFNAIGLILLQALDLATIEEDDEERKQKTLENRFKGRSGNVIKDIISPLPATDVPTIGFANYVLRQFFEEEPKEVVQLSTSRKTAQPKKKEPFQLFSEDRKSFVDNMGVLGINVKNADYLFTLSDMAFKGEYQKEYMGKKGKIKKLDPKYNDVAKMNFAAYFLYSIGLLPSETATIVRGNVKDMQKQKKEIKLSTSR